MTEDHYSLGLIGYPLEHSISPSLHQAALRALQLSGEYKLYPVDPMPKGEPQLKQLIEDLRAGEISGLNVTIPHKQSVLPWLDALTPTATAIGAVNTIYLDGGKVTGDNTDALGFLNDIKSSSLWIKDGTAIILGAGGAARAVCYALAKSGWGIYIAARRVEQAQSLVEHIAALGTGKQRSMKALELDHAAMQPFLENCNLIVNTTPAGMAPQVSGNPWPSELSLPSHIGVCDLIYNPAETAFLKQARAAGCEARNGVGMLVAQAVLSFELWTGAAAPKEAMLEAAAQTR